MKTTHRIREVRGHFLIVPPAYMVALGLAEERTSDRQYVVERRARMGKARWIVLGEFASKSDAERFMQEESEVQS